jgi:hypothetical protein
MNQAGMMVDATHCSRRTTFDLFELSAAPVIFSHSVPAGVKKHPRNVPHAQLLACPQTRALTRLKAAGIFLGSNDAGSESLSYARSTMPSSSSAPAHRPGLDFVFDRAELSAFIGSQCHHVPKRLHLHGERARAFGPASPACRCNVISRREWLFASRDRGHPRWKLLSSGKPGLALNCCCCLCYGTWTTL